MGSETRKNDDRRKFDPYYSELFIGKGIDIGAGHSPATPDCTVWDKAQGDATFLMGVPSEAFDWVHSSHCLEHIADTYTAMRNWWRILKPGGHLIITVPDFFLYEKTKWPSKFNTDHKKAFSILPTHVSWPVIKIFAGLEGCQIRWIRLNDKDFDYSDRIKDQTLGSAQSEIEVVARKVDPFWAP